MKKHNFSAGPSILPQEVFEKSAQAILDFNSSGLSILEISHRSKDFVAVMEEARASSPQGEWVAAALASSELGKIYRTLSRALENK